MRMQQRGLGAEMLTAAVNSLEIVESYPDDKYLPSFLIRGEAGGVSFTLKSPPMWQGIM